MKKTENFSGRVASAQPSAGQYRSVKKSAKVVSIVGLRITETEKTPAQIYARGLLRFKEGRFEEACLDFKQAGQEDPQRLVSCILMTSRCYQRTGKYDKAHALLKVGLARQGWTEEQATLLRQEYEQLEKPDLVRVAAAATRKDTAPPPRSAEPAPQAGAAEPAVAPKPAPDLYAAATSKWVTVPFGLLVMATIAAGYLMRGERHLTAESGLGYLLGIVGSLLMLVLMLYPLRKKARFMRNWGPIPHWFRFHMIAGIIGPVLVLFHANFELGSLNSRVVLGSTLLVAGSGIFGRYLYTKIHYGLYGKRISLEQLHDAISNNRDNLGAVFVYAPKIRERLLGFDAAVLEPSTGVFQSIARVLIIDLRRRWTSLRIALVLRRALKVAARRNHWSRREMSRQFRAANLLVDRHLTAVLKVAEFNFYERFFGLWHLLHMPLFLLLVIALVMHVIAVHMY